MIDLLPIKTEDVAEIKNWPVYDDGFAQMDYAMREQGWLDEFWHRPDTWIYVAKFNQQIVGFSLLGSMPEGKTEFRIAIHPHWTGKGLGKRVTIAALKAGLGQFNLDQIHLIVRRTNHRTAKLYKNLGFSTIGESNHIIQGKSIEFTDMVMTKENFYNLHPEED